MRLVKTLLGGTAALALLTAADSSRKEVEDYVHVPMPPGIHVEVTELAGAVFADANGMTLYRWPIKDLRNGDIGEQKGKIACDDQKFTETTGIMSPYPPGLVLPDLDTRPTCIQAYPPVIAPADAKAVGDFSLIKRPDGRMQWAYKSYALYTSVLDHKPGDVIGGVGAQGRKYKADIPAVREAVSPPPNIPAQFHVALVQQGLLLSAYAEISVYTYDKDGVNKSACYGACERDWKPVAAGGTAVPQGEWTVFERAPGIRQWAFRGHPLYTMAGDESYHTFNGSDVPGWHIVFVQRAPSPPKGFSLQDTRSGQVLADTHGHTLYVYHCLDDARDQQLCDHPDLTQAYRIAIGGDGSQETFMKTWPYVQAEKGAKSGSQSWSVMDIDPATGHRAKPGQADALHVWAYRDRPVYTFYDDKKPGDVEGDSWGEFTGKRNGFKAFWIRDAFRENAEY